MIHNIISHVYFLSQGSICLVALNNEFNDAEKCESHFMGNLIGAVEFSPSDFKDTAMEKIGADRKLYVADLCIRQDARRIGVATSLLRSIELYAERNLYKEVYLHVEVENTVARGLYIKNGYSEVAKCDWATVFTMARLHKPADSYVLLWKSLHMNVADGIQETGREEVVATGI
jgi:GNAT superfamily N-acetyltransferase